MRHQSAHYDVNELMRNGWLEAYQGFQSRPVFDGCTHIISFQGKRGTEARFIGVFRVLSRQPVSDRYMPPGCPYVEWLEQCRYFYVMERISGLEEIEGRIVVAWGLGGRAWHQKVRNKEVVEVRRKGEVLPTFADYLEFTITHEELVSLVQHQEANRGWRAQLAAVAGVYLILAADSGDQYVGSAYGDLGIWGRWESYAKTGHGGNALLKALLQDDAAYPGAFRYSVLQVLPKTTTRTEVLGWEKRYKEKLGTRARGLNLN